MNSVPDVNALFGALAVSFRRAVLIGKVIDLQKIEAGLLADVLDRLAAVILVDADADVVRANSRGRAMLEEPSVLCAINQRLATRSNGSEAELHAKLDLPRIEGVPRRPVSQERVWRDTGIEAAVVGVEVLHVHAIEQVEDVDAHFAARPAS